jgi:membrane protein
VEPIVERVLGVPRIGMAHAVYLRFSASSGPVLARGLAFVALFALVPALLVVVSIAGLIVRDSATRDQIVAILAEQFPPLEALVEEALQSAGNLAATTGVIGIVLLIWSASGLVRAVDGAFRVVFEDDGEGRTPLRDVAAVGAVAAGTFGAAIILVLLTLPGPINEIIGGPSPELRSLASLMTITSLIAVAYRFVPRPRPGWRMLALPAVGVGLAIWALTALFAVLGPLLFGSAELYGAFGALFLGLIWLSNVTQVILLGAAWVAERDRRARAAAMRQGEAPGL